MNCFVCVLGFKIVVLDCDLDIIDIMCCFGVCVYVGDLICLDFLCVVGFKDVKVFVVVLDDLVVVLCLVKYVCKECLDLYIIVCVMDWFMVFKFF